MNTPRRHDSVILAIVMLSYVMIVLDISIVITALPKIRDGLHFSVTGLSWVQNAYTLTFGGLLLLGARAGDILGRRRMFSLGLIVFTFSSLAIGIAQSPAWMIAARAVQGIGAAILAPSTLALLTAHFPSGQARTRALAYYASAAGVGASLGLVLGGVIADWLSWRVGFFINLPIGIALLVGARRYLNESERHAGHFDLIGAITSTSGTSALVYALVLSSASGWHDTTTLAIAIAGVALIAILVLNESRARQPIMPLHLFANRERSAAYAARALFLGAMVGFWFFSTQFLQGVLGFSPFQAGLAFLPTTLPNFAAAIAVPKLTQRFGNGPLLAAGLGVSLIGMAWLSCASPVSDYFSAIALPMVLIGIGQGFSLSPLTVCGIANVEVNDAGAASGLVNVAHQFGGSLGLAVLVVVASATHVGALDARGALAHRIAATFSAGSLMLALALGIVWLFIVRTQSLQQTDRLSV